MFMLHVDIDGYYSNKDLYFSSFANALKYIKNIRGVHNDDDKYMFDSMRDVIIDTDNRSYFNMRGIPYDTNNESDTRFGMIQITRCDFNPEGNIFYEVILKSGRFNEVVSNVKYSESMGFFNTEEEIKKCFEESAYIKSWERDVDDLRGEMQYLSFKKRSLIT